ncbi:MULTISPECIES: RidA family protein [Pseudoalteromonas]|uniref:RidA family protein n=1 Tax=Pseudoalteromonas TaxID=53246 RepID=UPI000FFE473A|nr:MULTISPECIES: RidA family protein [Pseudoalteromonas]MCG9760910.1 RidA family protein [Pseudoalteromonas sp. Isolate6]NKC21628.1 RidA family protein [Pseudoalteromonas galatheae]RXE88311.1 RidA family protein [Pseudoalteromonas sp. A757]
MRKLISSGSHLEEPIGFSRASRIGKNIAVAGTAPIDNGQTVFIGNVYEQTKYCLEISLKAIEEAGGSIEDVIRTRIMLTNIKEWEQAAKAHGELFSTQRPACTFVEVKGFIDPEWLVETEVDAVLSEA